MSEDNVWEWFSPVTLVSKDLAQLSWFANCILLCVNVVLMGMVYVFYPKLLLYNVWFSA